MALNVKRWSSRRLLYPIAIFAIIAPTVIMGLFGAYALREIELRPSQYRQELRDVQTGLTLTIEERVAELSKEPPKSQADIRRVQDDVEKYFADYNRAVAIRCFYGIGGKIVPASGTPWQRGLMPFVGRAYQHGHGKTQPPHAGAAPAAARLGRRTRHRRRRRRP